MGPSPPPPKDQPTGGGAVHLKQQTPQRRDMEECASSKKAGPGRCSLSPQWRADVAWDVSYSGVSLRRMKVTLALYLPLTAGRCLVACRQEGCVAHPRPSPSPFPPRALYTLLTCASASCGV